APPRRPPLSRGGGAAPRGPRPRARPAAPQTGPPPPPPPAPPPAGGGGRAGPTRRPPRTGPPRGAPSAPAPPPPHGRRARPRRRAAARASARARTPKAARLSGLLEELPFPALLHEAHGLRASGVLTLRSADQERVKQILLADGRPAAVRSNAARERLGEWL